tara:strand:- start:484 stop:1233 length:750 start_codon:yes stop_codon:yes gene_type:complete
MANTQTTVPIFTAAQVLEAAQLNNSAATGVPVFANTTTRDAGFGGAGEKALAEGQLCYLESTNVVQYYDGAAWATVGPSPAVSSGLTFITSGTITTSATAQINNVFSSTYDNYLMLINYTSGDGTGQFLQLGTSGSPDAGSNYNWNLNQNNSFSGGATVLTSQLSTTKWTYTGKVNTGGGNTVLNIFSPNLASKSSFANLGGCLNSGVEISNWWCGGALNTSTQYTDITITTSSSTTSFTYKIYGYSNS